MKFEKSTVILFFILIFLSIISLFIGVVEIKFNELLTYDLNIWYIFIISRIPRLLAILCTGIGMSVSGLIMQQLCCNKFVSPTTASTISFAQFGILLALLFFKNSTLWDRVLFSFITAILGTWLFIWFVQSMKFVDTVMVPLVGIMFGNVIGGITNYLAYKYDMVQALSSWLTGHFSLIIKGKYEILWITLPLVILAFIFSNCFNIVGIGRDFSKNLGVSYNVILFLGITISSMITASVVVTVGSIPYIGLIIPNIVTIFKGDKISSVLIDTALFGAVFVLICDILSRIIIFPYEISIELIIGILGSIIFILLIIYRLKNGRKSIKFSLNNLCDKNNV